MQLEGPHLDKANAVRHPILLNMAAAQLRLGDCQGAVASCSQVTSYPFLYLGDWTARELHPYRMSRRHSCLGTIAWRTDVSLTTAAAGRHPCCISMECAWMTSNDQGTVQPLPETASK